MTESLGHPIDFEATKSTIYVPPTDVYNRNGAKERSYDKTSTNNSIGVTDGVKYLLLFK